MRFVTWGTAIVLALLGAEVNAREPSLEECLEASEFILHAAMSRDDGMSREDFLGRVHADLLAIQQFPPEYRWFAQDADDEKFLIESSEDVFSDPRSPQAHQNDVLDACVRRMSAKGESDPESPTNFQMESDENDRL